MPIDFGRLHSLNGLGVDQIQRTQYAATFIDDGCVAPDGSWMRCPVVDINTGRFPSNAVQAPISNVYYPPVAQQLPVNALVTGGAAAGAGTNPLVAGTGAGTVTTPPPGLFGLSTPMLLVVGVAAFFLLGGHKK